MKKLDDILKYYQPTNFIVSSDNYNDDFETPVLTAGKSFLLGYTDDQSGIFKELPAIIFDDFTTSFHYVDFPFKVKSSALKILVPRSKDVDIKFVYYRMLGLRIDTTLHKRYWISKFSQLKIDLPDFETQKRIASILDDAQALKQKTEKLLAEYDELAQSIFLEMFGGDSEITPIKLKNLIKLYGGGTPSKKVDKYWNGDISWASVKDLKSKYLKSTIDKISLKGLENSATRLVSKGSLIIATRMAVGKCVKTNINVAINQDLKMIEIIKDLNVSYLHYFLMSKKEYFNSVSSGATVKGIKIEQILNLDIKVPSIELQNEFAEKVALIEQQKELAKQELKESEDLFNCLLQKAFKGELN